MIGVFVDRVLPPPPAFIARQETPTWPQTRATAGSQTKRPPANGPATLLPPNTKFRSDFSTGTSTLMPPSPPRQYAGNRVFDDPVEEKHRKMFHTVPSALSAHLEQVVRDMKWDWETGQGWFTTADVKKRSKKVSLYNIVFPPLSFVVIKFVALRVIIMIPWQMRLWVGCLPSSAPEPQVAAWRGGG